ncbi:AzlD domain-containing protein [Skermania piniformis]|uniref:AzlD domain-containing protein n=1 Tax=Skermania pinensis TaxID=39122 RepID=A0ABX8S8E6_9ACTN|nr:AzlD domain-containing protein [Skermania piniformis]QXQ13721.1 AzlD domain-containing protein [Skermania piniformis]
MIGIPAALGLLAVGTLALRAAGPALHDRCRPPARLQALVGTAAVVLLVAVIATATVIDGQHFAGWARPAGALVGGVLAVRRAPFVLVVVAASGTTAALRWCGVA